MAWPCVLDFHNVVCTIPHQPCVEDDIHSTSCFPSSQNIVASKDGAGKQQLYWVEQSLFDTLTDEQFRELDQRSKALEEEDKALQAEINQINQRE